MPQEERSIRNIFGSTALAAALFSTPVLAQSSPVIGAWTIATETPQGRFETTLTFSEAGGVYAADLEAIAIPEFAPAEDVISDVVIDGTSFSFKRTITTPQGPMELRYAGTVQGDALTGQASSAAGAVSISGTRR